MTEVRVSVCEAPIAVGRAVAAPDRALDRRRQPGGDPVAGEIEAWNRRRGVRPLRAGRAPARRSRAARGSTVPRNELAPRADGQRVEQLVVGEGDELRVRARRGAARRRSTPATGATRVPPTTAACRTPTACAGPGRPTNGSSRRADRTRVDGHNRDDAVAAARCERSAPSAACRPRTDRPAQTTARPTMTAGALQRSPLLATSGAATWPESTVAGRAGPDRSAVLLDERPRRLGVHLVQRRVGRPIAAARGSAPNISPARARTPARPPARAAD